MNDLFRGSPYIITSVFYLITFIFVIIQGKHSYKIIKLKYNKIALVLYMVSVIIALSFRFFDLLTCEFTEKIPIFLNYIVSYIPGVLMITASILFLNYLLNSFCNKFFASSGHIYEILKWISTILLGLFWGISIPLLGVSLYRRYSNTQQAIVYAFFYVYGITCILVAGFTIFIFSLYIKELRKYRNLLKDTEMAIFTVIFAAFLHALVKVINAVCVLTKEWEVFARLGDLDNIPYYQICYSIYYIISDIFPILAYTVYFKKDTDHLEITDVFEEQIDDVDIMQTSIAQAIDGKLVELMLKKRNSNVSRPIIEAND